MNFTYNGTTISQVIGKPSVSGTRETLTVAIKFFLQSSTAAGFWTTFMANKSNLEVPGKKFILSPGFTVDPSLSSSTGTTLNPSLEIIGADTDTDAAKTCQYTITFLWNDIIGNYRNLEHSVNYAIDGEKTVSISIDMSKNNKTTSLENFKDSAEDIAEIVLAMYGYDSTSPNYKLINWDISSTDVRAGETSHNLNFHTCTLVYKQMFFNDEVDDLVSATLVNPNLEITPERILYWSVQSSEMDIRERFKVTYSTQVRVDYDKQEFYDPNTAEINTDEDFLSLIFTDICLPRIEKFLENLNKGTFEVIDGEISYNPSSRFISASLIYDNNASGVVSVVEKLETETAYGYMHKVKDPKKRKDKVFIHYPGEVTTATLTSIQELRQGSTPLGISFKPSNAYILNSYQSTEKGQVRISKIENGYPVYETTTLVITKIVYVISDFQEKKTLQNSESVWVEQVEASKKTTLPKYNTAGGKF